MPYFLAQTSGPGGRGGVYTYSSHKGHVWAELISGEKRKIPVSDVINKWRDEVSDSQEIELMSVLERFNIGIYKYGATMPVLSSHTIYNE